MNIPVRNSSISRLWSLEYRHVSAPSYLKESWISFINHVDWKNIWKQLCSQSFVKLELTHPHPPPACQKNSCMQRQGQGITENARRHFLQHTQLNIYYNSPYSNILSSIRRLPALSSWTAQKPSFSNPACITFWK